MICSLSCVLCAFPRLPLNLHSSSFATRLNQLSVSFRTLCYQSVSVENLWRRNRQTLISGKERNKKKMDRGMASLLPTEKLDRSNYASLSYKMHQYLLGHGYWSHVDGANNATPESTHRDVPAWEQATSRVLHCFPSSVSDHQLSYIRDASVMMTLTLWLEKIWTHDLVLHMSNP